MQFCLCLVGALSRSPSLPERYEAVSARFNTDANANTDLILMCVSSTLNQTRLSHTDRCLFGYLNRDLLQTSIVA